MTKQDMIAWLDDKFAGRTWCVIEKIWDDKRTALAVTLFVPNYESLADKGNADCCELYEGEHWSDIRDKIFEAESIRLANSDPTSICTDCPRYRTVFRLKEEEAENQGGSTR